MPKRISLKKLKKDVLTGNTIQSIKSVNKWVCENMARHPRPDRNTTEDEMVQLLDDKKLLEVLIEEFLPVFKQMQYLDNLDDKLDACAKIAPLILARSMVFGDAREARGAANDVLNRVLGRPVERQMRVSYNETRSVTEVDNEIKRLVSKFGQDGCSAEADIVAEVEGEGEDTGRDEG